MHSAGSYKTTALGGEMEGVDVNVVAFVVVAAVAVAVTEYALCLYR